MDIIFSITLKIFQTNFDSVGEGSIANLVLVVFLKGNI